MNNNNINYNWSKYIELKLQKWANLANNYSIIHESEVNRLTFKNKFLQIPSIIFGASSTIFSGISSQNNTINHMNWYSLIALILSGLSTVLLTYIQTIKPEQNISINKTLSKNYRLISLRIETQLSMNYENRIDGIVFLNDISKQLQDLIETSDTASLIALHKLKNLHINYDKPNLLMNNSIFLPPEENNTNNDTIINIQPQQQSASMPSMPSMPKNPSKPKNPAMPSKPSKPSIIFTDETERIADIEEPPINIPKEPKEPKEPKINIEKPPINTKFDKYFNNPELENMMNFQLDRFNENN